MGDRLGTIGFGQNASASINLCLILGERKIAGRLLMAKETGLGGFIVFTIRIQSKNSRLFT